MTADRGLFGGVVGKWPIDSWHKRDMGERQYIA